jgi:YggT family protein
MISIIARVLSAVVSVYSLLCFLRILVSWVPSFNLGRAGALLCAATDPFLDFFSRYLPLRAGNFDFSPILALASLSVLNNILTALAFAGTISLGYILGMLLSAAWSAVAFLVSFLAVSALVRIIAYAARLNSTHPLWMVLDSMLNPVLFRINRLIYRNRIVNYLQSLVTGFAVFVLLRVAGGELVRLFVRLLDALPI